MLVLTAEQEIICVDIVDRGFILATTFPKENSYVFFDNLVYENTTMIDHRNSKFEMFSHA